MAASVSYMLFTSSSNGRATAANQGNTGAPGDNNRTCVTCHNGGPIQVSLDLDLLDLNGDEVSEYEPGASYTVRVRIENTGAMAPRGYGFQMVALDAPLDENGADIRNWIDTSSNNYKIAQTNQREYVEQAGPSQDNEFLVGWTAPMASSGKISFYASGNGINFNGGTSGDGAALNKIEVSEKISTSTLAAQVQTIKAWPNPVVDQTNLTFDTPFTGEIILRDLNGRLIEKWSFTETETASLNVSNADDGMFLLEAQDVLGNKYISRLMIL